MALTKQQVSLPFAGGIDTKTDDKQVVPTRLLELENAVFTKLGVLQKRFGYDILKQSIIDDDSSISTAAGVSTFKTELLLFNGTKLYSYIDASMAWKEKGSLVSVELKNQSIIKNTFQQTNPDYAYNNGLGCYVWDDSSGGCRFTVVDEETKNIIQENQLLSSTGQTPKVVGVGSYFFIYYIDTTFIKFRYIQVSTPQNISSPVDLVSTVNASDKIYDVQKIGDRAYVAYNTNNGSNSISVFYQLSNKVVSNEHEYVGESATGGISITSDENFNIWISWSSGSDVKYFIRDYNLSSSILVPTILETISNVRNIASVLIDNSEVTFMYEVESSPDNYLKTVSADSVGTVGSPSVFKRSLGLVSKFFDYNDQHYITTTFDSYLQSTYFVMSLNGDVITKINQVSGGGLSASSVLSNVIEINSGIFNVPVLKKGILETHDSIVFTALGIDRAQIDFISLNNFITSELGNNLHIVGGILQSYDGATVNETGFFMFPEDVSAMEVNTGTGNLSNGDYQHAVVYAWTDNQGQIHRSAPSIPLQTTVASGPSNIELTIPTLRLTKKENVYIEVYRTEVNSGEVFYKVTSNTDLTLNDPTVDTITFIDDVSGVDLIGNEILYTTGGVLDNISPPATNMVVNWKNRLVVKSADEPNVLWYSKIRNEGFPVEFSDALKIVVDQQGGDITAIGVVDDKLLIFKDSTIHIQVGDGPNNLGEQSDFGLPQKITADAGCSDVNSIVETPVGILFKSNKGIYEVDRSLDVSYIGAEVEKYNGSRITSAKLVPNTNQVRFTTEDNLCLVYDYFFKQWSTFTNHEAVGATIFDQKYAFAKSNGQLFLENSEKYTDGANSIKMKLVTSWIQISDLQGFQRVYKFLLLGQYKSKHRLKIKLGFDFNSAFTQETEINPFDVLNPTAYGDSSPYGAEEVYGGRYPLYQWRIFPKRQKCQSMRVSIEDVMDDYFGESFNISGMRLEIGVKQGSNKLESTKSFGAS